MLFFFFNFSLTIFTVLFASRAYIPLAYRPQVVRAPERAAQHGLCLFFQSVTGAVTRVKAPAGPTACSVWRATCSMTELAWNSALQVITRSQTRARVSSP